MEMLHHFTPSCLPSPPLLAYGSTLCRGPPAKQVFAFDAVSYFLQAFAGEILLIFPIVYGFTNSAPFNTWNIEFALYFFPFIITGILPTVAALGWQKTPSAKVTINRAVQASPGRAKVETPLAHDKNWMGIVVFVEIQTRESLFLFTLGRLSNRRTLQFSCDFSLDHDPV